MMCKLKSLQIYLFFLSALLFFSCKQSNRPDISKIKLDIKIERFDRDLYAGQEKSIAETSTKLAQQYGYFYDDYIHRVVGNADLTGPEILSTLYKDKAYKDLTAETDSVFPDLKPYEKSLTESFKYIKYYYPKVRVPRFIAYISGFAYQNIVGQDYLGIGLDMFLGKNSKFYGAIVQSAPRYISSRYAPEYLVTRTVETYAHEELFPEPDEYRNLLSKMLHNGKILYFMDQILPENTPDTVKIGYTDKQLRWCQTYQKEIWGYLLENNYLYETDSHKYDVLLGEGPFTPGVGVNKESAPKLAVWTGWQIIRSYMQNHPDVTLQQLMAEKDMQKILNEARYKP